MSGTRGFTNHGLVERKSADRSGRAVLFFEVIDNAATLLVANRRSSATLLWRSERGEEEEEGC